jgi:MFS family permease
MARGGSTHSSEERTAAPPSPWRPLRNPVFRNLLIANLVSDVGAFMQAVGAAWLMIALGASPLYVALVQTASTLPFFLFALPAGALGDIVDRRRLILVTEYWMLAAAVVLAAVTITGVMSPWLLLGLTFALAAGDAWEQPSWRALLPELVPREDLAAANALNGIEFNLARALGPALAGVLIAAAGVGSAFVLNALSFLAVIVVIARWKRPASRSAAPPETLGGATVAALRYVRHSPGIHTLVARTVGVMFFATAVMALLPLVATRTSDNPLGYGALLGCFGLGAVLGALALPRLRRSLSMETTLSLAPLLIGISLVGAGWLHHLGTLAAFMAIGGAGWMVFISLMSSMVQQVAPAWVRARVVAMSLLAFQGSLALGSVVWGVVAQHAGLGMALTIAGCGAAAAGLLRFVLPLPDVDLDLGTWNHWPVPARIADLGYDVNDGPVLIAVEYDVVPERRASFVRAAHRLGRLRRRDGASRWALYRDTEAPEIYIETFVVNSWAEHLRQHERPIKADRPFEEAVGRHVRKAPRTRHFLYADDEHD